MTTLILADCLDALRDMPENSIDAVVTDPPYGLEFMGKEWDRLTWDQRGGSGFTSPGIGERKIAWPSFGGIPFGGANPTCAICGGRLRGAKKCACEDPDWRVKGHPVRGFRESAYGPVLAQRMHDHAPDGYRAGPDMQVWHLAWAREAFRVLKPGGHLVAFGGTRTYHRLACALEDAGFEIRDQLQWLYGSGFPKSLDVSKAIDKASGVERPIVKATPSGGFKRLMVTNKDAGFRPDDYYPEGNKFTSPDPVTDAARAWEGWGTALKPSHESICLARKPLSEPNVAANVLRWGTGAINVNGCRVIGPRGDGVWGTRQETCQSTFNASPDNAEYRTQQHELGRWPANVLLDEEAAAKLDEQSGDLTSGLLKPGHHDGGKQEGRYGVYRGRELTHEFGGDTGGASRFFYCAKTDPSERGIMNNHPTVKPVALMRWLCRLVTPPGGTILDPFMGSGSTGLAAIAEGYEFVGIEREAEYMAIAKRRLSPWQAGVGHPDQLSLSEE